MASRLTHRNLASKRSNLAPRSAFTLIEILVVIGIIALLAALLFPAFTRARESSRQASCQSNLHQVYMAVQQYFQDERRYPDSLTDLLPEGSKFEDGNAGGAGVAGDGVIDSRGTAYLRGGNSVLLCPDDDTTTTATSGTTVTVRSSYGALRKDITPPTPGPLAGATPDVTQDLGRYVYNYWGYDPDGFAYPNPTLAAASTVGHEALLVDSQPFGTATTAVFDPYRNQIKYSLSNRFAEPQTIITHCIYHRIQTANNIAVPGTLSYTGTDDDSANALDMVLRLDGSVKATNVSLYHTSDLWRNQASGAS